MSTLIKLLEELTDMRDDDVEPLIEAAEQAETLTHRVATMLRKIADLEERERRARTRERKLEDAMRKIVKYPPPEDTPSDHPAFRTMNEMRGIAIEALEEELPF
jgi:hypothetical protein